MDKGKLEYAIKALEEFYAEHGESKTLDYAYGFFDAVAVIRELAEENIRILSDTL